MNQPKKYTSTELQRATGKVLNEAFNSGGVEVHHRDRGVLLLMTEDKLYELVAMGIQGYREVSENAKSNN